MAEDLRRAVWAAYSDAAADPERAHPFPVGRAFAQGLGYTADALEGVPECSVEAFTGVSNVAFFADLSAGDTVLDLGCGAGLDSLIAARRVGNTGRVVGVDFSQLMLDRARCGAQAACVRNLALVLADGERLPLASGSIEVALVNGIFNLNPAREAIFAELARVLRPGGSVFGAELVLREPARTPPELDRLHWFA